VIANEAATAPASESRTASFFSERMFPRRKVRQDSSGPVELDAGLS
jgi:hypothetical protein